MQYSPKDFEFLGRQVAAGHYVTRSLCIMAVLFALLSGGIIGYMLAPSDNGEVKVPLDSASNAMGGSNQAPFENRELFEAIIAATQRTQANPTDAEAWAHLGNLYFDASDFNKSIEAYEKSLAIKPNVPDVLVDCGVMYRAVQNFNKALEYFDKALSIDSKHQFALFNAGVVLHNDLKKDAEGIARWRALVAINPQFKTPDGTLLADLVRDHQ